MEMPPTTKVSTRLTTISPPTPLCQTLTPRWWSPMAAAPIRPNTAPEAPPVKASGDSSSAPNDPTSREARYRPIDAHRAQRRLQQLPEPVEDHHIEEEVDQAVVDEPRRDQAVQLAAVDGRSEQRQVDREPAPALAEAAAVAHRGEEEHDHVEGDDRLGDHRAGGLPLPHPLGRRAAGRP